LIAGKPVVLVAAPQRAVRLLVAAALKPNGFRVIESQGRVPTAEELVDVRPDVIVLEADESPGRTAARVRELASISRAPVLLMSPHATPTRVADILDAGADDHVARPFDPNEFVARVRSLVRRRRGALHVGTVSVGGAVVDLAARTIAIDGQERSLTRAEWALLSLLIQNQGAIVLREELLAAAFGEAAFDDPTLLRVAISRLRRKLGLAPWEEGPIRTVHGIGYAFDPDEVLPRAWSPRRRGPRDPMDAVAAGEAGTGGGGSTLPATAARR
jgi:DNA-binding response OmpR family regulator